MKIKLNNFYKPIKYIPTPKNGRLDTISGYKTDYKNSYGFHILIVCNDKYIYNIWKDKFEFVGTTDKLE